MRTRMLASLGALAFCLAPLLAATADDAKPIVIELKSFTFKHAEGKSDLFGHNDVEEKLFLYTNGTTAAKVKLPADGDYEIVVKASGENALNVGAKFKLALDGKQVGKETETADGPPKDYKFTTTLKGGVHELTIEFTNDVFKEGEYDRNLYVHGVSLKKVK